MRCAESLSPEAAVTDLVIVDTAGREGQSDWGGDFKVISLEENRGFGAAVNRGVAEVEGDYLLLTNADVYFEAGAVERLLAGLKEHSEWALAAPLLRDPAGRVQESSFRFPGLAQTLIDVLPAPDWLRRSRFNGRYPSAWATARDFEIDHPLGACLLVRREPFAEVGGFDEGYFLYSEEIDLCRRLKEGGWKSGHIAEAVAVHVGGASTGRDWERTLEELYISRVRYFDGHHGGFYAVVARLLMAAGLAASPLWNQMPRHVGFGLGVREALRLARQVLKA